MPNSEDQYFATLPPKELVEELKVRVGTYTTFLQGSGRADRYQRNYSQYYGNGTSTPSSTSQLMSTGSNAELTTVKFGDYRSLLQQSVILVTQGRPALRAKAANTDYKSKTQTIVGDSLIDYYLREIGQERDAKRSVELALLYDEAYLVQLWNQNSGDVVMAADMQEEEVQLEDGEEETSDGQKPLPTKVFHAGDMEQFLFGPADVARDVALRSSKIPWYIFRLQKNRFDLIADYPTFREQILASTDVDEYLPGTYSFSTPAPAEGSDLIDAYLFLHEKTPACPAGRLTLYVGDTAIVDGPLPYKKLTVSRIAPADQDQTSFGYSSANDLVGIQELKDGLCSIVASNELTFGGQNIAVKKGAGFNWTLLGEGFTLFELDSVDDIKPLQLAKTAPEIFNFLETLDRKQETLSGINSVARGNPEASLKSGSALALVEAQAIRFLSGLQESYYQLLESWGTNLIEILQTYADEPRIIAIAGKNNRAYLRSFKFTKDDIASISRVQVENVSALSKTYAGKLQMAQDLLQAGKLQRPEQYLQLVETGRMEPLFHDDLQDLLMIDQENESLQEGQPVVALITDLHKQHILAHRSLLNDPETRLHNKELRDRVQEHIMEHFELLMDAARSNPMILWVTGQEMPPIGPSPEGPESAPEKPPGPNLPAISSPQGPTERQAQGVAAPSMPKNPLTGEPAKVA